ncbi:ABC transporter ATP-binding protein [Geminicoccus flavidas]|uniref:ABC transporter ATP-binding protein n=1 Tax=Geminicoccus flavidas TaxID=2506407 RepID=UPI00135AC90A|nr:ABC transporter ATP-binding protein [Geminicoccus flavidas]
MSQFRLEAVQRAFGERVVLNRLSLSIAEGEAVAVVGRSGCGKSTLLRLLAGLDRPDAGRVTIDGTLVMRPRPDVAVVFQEPRLLPWLDVLGNVMVGLGGKGDRGQAREQALRALRRVGLAEAAAKLPKTLSGGMAQRVGIARALVRRPRLLLLDEPFSALDALTKIELQGALDRIRAEDGPALLLVTHDLEEAAALADRVVVLETAPAGIVLDLAIDLPHPRNRRSAAFQAIEARLARALGGADAAEDDPGMERAA